VAVDLGGGHRRRGRAHLRRGAVREPIEGRRPASTPPKATPTTEGRPRARPPPPTSLLRRGGALLFAVVSGASAHVGGDGIAIDLNDTVSTTTTGASNDTFEIGSINENVLTVGFSRASLEWLWFAGVCTAVAVCAVLLIASRMSMAKRR
jgi:hypothetical protein